MKHIKTAVIGFGLAGRVFHAPFISAVPGLQLQTIVQRSGDQAAQAYPQAETGVQIARSVEEVLLDPAIELVVVATPNRSHFALAAAALRAGKHVVVDKPLTTSSKDALDLIRLATVQDRLVIPFHNRRWDGDFLTVQDILQTGELGRLVSFQSRFDRFRPQQKPGSWKETPGIAHGVLFDLGPHLLDQALVLFGTPERLLASVRQDRDQTEIDDAFDIELQYPGLRVLLGATMLAAEPAARYLLHGTRGSFRKFGVDPQEPSLVAGGRVPLLGSSEPWLAEPSDAWGMLRVLGTDQPALQARSLATRHGDYRTFYAAVRDSIREGTPPPVTPEDAWRVLRLLELARQSADQQTSLPVDLALPPHSV